MLKIGLTGGIGAGKTYVSKIIEQLGYPVFNSDEEAKRLMIEDQKLIHQIKDIFGAKAYLNKQINRPYLADQIFNNPELRAKLDSIVHPAVRKSFANWCHTQNSNIVFNEAAILFETESYKDFDFTILVVAPESLRIARIAKRDQATPEAIASRIKSQWGDDQKMKLASFIINNDGKEPVLPQVERILSELVEEER